MKKKIRCPLPKCGKAFIGEEEIINHMKENHKEVKILNFGGKKISLED